VRTEAEIEQRIKETIRAMGERFGKGRHGAQPHHRVAYLAKLQAKLDELRWVQGKEQG
jgi:hypothetical protein